MSKTEMKLTPALGSYPLPSAQKLAFLSKSRSPWFSVLTATQEAALCRFSLLRRKTKAERGHRQPCIYEIRMQTRASGKGVGAWRLWKGGGCMAGGETLPTRARGKRAGRRVVVKRALLFPRASPQDAFLRGKWRLAGDKGWQ